MTPEEAHTIAREAAEAAVNNTFLHLGYDIADREQVRALKRDLAHLRRWRDATDTVSKQGLTAAVTVLVTCVLGAIWLGIQASGRP